MARFPETRWSLVHRARSSSPEVSRAALNDLLSLYTAPVDRYLRAKGVASQQIADLRQAFFLDLLEHAAVSRFDRDRNVRFRSFLLGALERHMARRNEHARAAKRWSGTHDLSLDDVSQETGSNRREPVSTSNPEREFMMAWIAALVARALEQLAEEYKGTGRSSDLEAFGALLTSDGEPDHAALARSLGISVVASRTRLKRLRQRFHVIVREAVAETVSDPREIDDELRSLLP